MSFVLVINSKMPTIVCWHFKIDDHNKFHAYIEACHISIKLNEPGQLIKWFFL